ncbi:PA14 domain-containing protein [Mucilaginibacter sp. UYCu711]|uniref:PA14 domain-containing protein n=1 Tax=Mucilaginibacter sp. UYCu711 TaxID=3156339 RepID=UPI003D219968
MKTINYFKLVFLLSLFLFFTTSCKKAPALIPKSLNTNLSIGSGLILAGAQMGSVRREEWDNVEGNDVSSIPLKKAPTSSAMVTSLEGPLNVGYNYGARIRGYIYPPADGHYTFWIAADDSGELWLSTDDNPANKTKIASTESWTDSRQWDKFPVQKSAQVTLQANHKYYIEILHKQGQGGGNLSVQWMLPDNSLETPIPRERLSPYMEETLPGTGTISREVWDNFEGNDVVNIPLQNPPSATAQLTSLEGPLNSGNTFGERIRGYIFPPQDGDYTFWIAADDSGELWLSSDDDPAKKNKIACTVSWTDPRQWDKLASQQSAPVPLKAGHKYYIEALHKQGWGGSNLSVQWMLPDKTHEAPIPGSRLSPYIITSAVIAPPSTEIPAKYVESVTINLNGAHDIMISGKSISGGNSPAINLTNCYNIHITRNRLINSTDVGIHLYNCQNITIDYNYFTNVSSGVYAEQTSGGGIVVNYNQFLNMKGPFPRGQFVQFNNVRGAGNFISYNKGENILGQSFPEDAINLYQSTGTPESPIKIVGNWIRGGGPSASGGGIMLGDNGGSYLSAKDNILVDPGEYGMAIAGGDHNELVNNKIYGRSQSFTNVGLYVNSIGGFNETNSKVTGNQINFFNASGYNNNWWLAPGVEKPAGWDDGGNLLGASLSESILPASIIDKH